MIAFLAGLAAKALFNARHDASAASTWWGGLQPSTRKWIIRGALLIAGFFLHQHFAHRAIDAAKSDARAAQQKADQAVLDQTVANYRAAAKQAREADAKNKVRVETEQQQISERSSHVYEARIADARATAERLRSALAQAGANPGRGGAAPVSGVPVAAVRPAQAADPNRLSIDERLTATEQAIQLDELIKWNRRQAAVDPNGTQPTQGAKP